ncbi:uncharacterized protein LOC105441510 [Strongylocentrotus purpuratus]|uniref:Uncharacterized protein n=1 Tax=Strongylocentrotus purpuratus TaxID=7668 RepID=A0A7M7NQP8_STRPU|nr:uncharacterized protein LOC105441510 [Strongylocentrotus purpuratus]
MKHSVAGGAAAILEKSRSRMRGQHFTLDGRGTSKKTEPKQPSKNTEDDDIAAYLSQLSKKTSGKKKNMDDIGSGMSDLSLSDEAKNSSSMKFMKKSSTASAVLPGSSRSAQSIQQSARPMSGKKSTSFTSSALQRASKYNAKIASRKIIVDSDSSDDRSRDQYQELDVTVDTSSPPAPAENRDKYRFMKKPSGKVEPVVDGESKQENPSSFATQLENYPRMASKSNATESKMKAKLSTKAKSESATMPLTSTPIRNTQQSSSRRNVYNKIMAELDTDEESIDYLIGDTAEYSSFVKDVQKADTVSDQVSENRASPRRLSDTGYLAENLEHISVVESVVESSVQSSIGEDVGLTFFGLQTIDDLLPPNHRRFAATKHLTNSGLFFSS